MQKTTNQLQLKNHRKENDKCQNDEVKKSFGDNGSEKGIERYLFFFRERPAPDNFTHPRNGCIGKVTDHEGEKCGP